MDEPEKLPPPADAYLTPAGILRAAEDLARERGGRSSVIGTTWEGRTISAFRFGPEEEGGAFLLSLLHASEWIGSLALLATAERITRKQPELPLTMIPIANPDGVARVHGSLGKARARFHRGNAHGRDLNRNFPIGHRAEGPMSRLPWYRPGPHPESEPETAACAALARKVRPSVAISFHSFGRWVFYPPAHRWRPWPKTEAHGALLRRVEGAEGIGYRAGQLGRWAPWFRAYGTEIDFLSGEVGALSYLIEVSRGGILRWGHRKLLQPFFWYNPPRPQAEVARIADLCERLVSEKEKEPSPHPA